MNLTILTVVQLQQLLVKITTETAKIALALAKERLRYLNSLRSMSSLNLKKMAVGMATSAASGAITSALGTATGAVSSAIPNSLLEKAGISSDLLTTVIPVEGQTENTLQFTMSKLTKEAASSAIEEYTQLLERLNKTKVDVTAELNRRAATVALGAAHTILTIGESAKSNLSEIDTTTGTTQTFNMDKDGNITAL